MGTTANDHVGLGGATALGNGNYVVHSSWWDNGGVANAGAATWGNGASGIVGPVSTYNSLVGTTADDHVGSGGVTALSNGNYVVGSAAWSNGGAANAGAVTWGDGATGITGPVSTLNSLVGTTAHDRVGLGGVTALSNGNYVVRSPYWDNGGIASAGAATWGNGASGIVGPVSTLNSLVGSTADDRVGDPYPGVTALSNGNYVVRSPHWHNGALADAGAVTWGSGVSGVAGPVSAANSLVGSTADDLIGSRDVTALSDGNYVVRSPDYGWTDIGAVTWGNGTAGTAGPVTPANSVLGAAADGGNSLTFAYDYIHNQLVVGRPADNIVTLFKPFYSVFLPVVVKNGS